MLIFKYHGKSVRSCAATLVGTPRTSQAQSDGASLPALPLLVTTILTLEEPLSSTHVISITSFDQGCGNGVADEEVPKSFVPCHQPS